MSDNISVHSTNIYSGDYRKLAKELNNQNVRAIENIVISEKLNLNTFDSLHQLSLLNWCLLNDKLKSFKTLLRLGADPNKRDSLNKFPQPIIVAAAKKDIEYLKLALEFGGDPNAFFPKAQWFRDFTPMGGAIFSLRLENVQLLTEKGADLNSVQSEFSNPLENALVQEQIDMVKYFIEKGADYKKMPRYNVDSLEILDYLRNMAFPLNSTDHRIKMEVVDMLKSKGLDYFKYPIPDNIRTSHDVNFLSKY